MKSHDWLVTAAVVGLLAGGVGCNKPSEGTNGAGMQSPAGHKHGCRGQNDCKGQGGCATDRHACKGQNACKGQGGCNMS